ncbi:hypothetical protein B0A48_08763 [Cryoendolithus antarcticus]|uniref:Uncharacterized protein n=1 Tax=Cryoendolithus antarcticus TaxID=1507870 RepID=A0A1V8T444_9PEZI|nr:hypothetical protein B0A48_08763 [Cryoendolithus antarcticus]
MAKITRLAAILTPLALATVAIAFAITAATHKDWSSRNFYTDDQSQWSPATIDSTEYRSPFQICGYRRDNTTLSLDSRNNTYTYVCQRFGSSGSNKTSCESLNYTLTQSDARYGDERLCQQIHWAGNLVIASTSFIGIGFFFTFFLASLSMIMIFTPNAAEQDSPRESEAHAEASKHATAHSHQPQHQHVRKRPHERFLLPVAPWFNVLLIFCFVFGGVLYIFAQFYGVLAFVQSAPDNGAFASFGNNNNGDTVVGLNREHSPWVQGKALSVYASAAWLSAGLAAMAAGFVWRLPRISGRNIL